jgi:hypothetical protein
MWAGGGRRQTLPSKTPCAQCARPCCVQHAASWQPLISDLRPTSRLWRKGAAHLQRQPRRQLHPRLPLAAAPEDGLKLVWHAAQEVEGGDGCARERTRAGGACDCVCGCVGGCGCVLRSVCVCLCRLYGCEAAEDRGSHKGDRMRAGLRQAPAGHRQAQAQAWARPQNAAPLRAHGAAAARRRVAIFWRRRLPLTRPRRRPRAPQHQLHPRLRLEPPQRRLIAVAEEHSVREGGACRRVTRRGGAAAAKARQRRRQRARAAADGPSCRIL